MYFVYKLDTLQGVRRLVDMADAFLMRSDFAHYNIHWEVNWLVGFLGERRVFHLIGYKVLDLDPTRQYLTMEIIV